MATLSTELKKYALLATGVAATSVAAQAQITETEVGDIYENDDYRDDSYDLNYDGEDDLYNYRSNYSSSTSSSYFSSVNSTNYRIEFTGQIAKDVVIDESSSYSTSQNLQFLKTKKDQEVYFGFKLVKGEVGCDVADEKANEIGDRDFSAVGRTAIACNSWIEEGTVYYGWLKYKYADYVVEVEDGGKLVAAPKALKLSTDAAAIKEEVASIKKEVAAAEEEPTTKTVTGIKFMGYAIADVSGTSLKAGQSNDEETPDDETPAGLSTASASDLGLTVYPNPTINEVNVVANTNVESVSVLNLSGQKVMVNMPATFDVSELNKGMYILEVKTAEGIVLQKFTKN